MMKTIIERPYQQVKLKNGITVVCEPMPNVHSVSVGVWVGNGSRFETPEVSGVSHFLEHMMFKGTATRSARDIAEQIDAVGGQLNAFTSKEYTCYYAKVLDRNFDLSIELLSDMVMHSVFDAGELNKERSVVLEEIKSYEDSPGDLIHDIFVGEVLKNHPLGNNILGTPQTVGSINREVMQKYLLNHYTPNNIVISVAGNVQIEQVLAEVEGKFDAIQGSFLRESAEMPNVESNTILKYKDTEQVYLCIGGRGYSRKEPRKFSAMLLDGILGGGISSRLFQRLREDEGLVYETGTSHSSFSDVGIFTVYAGTSMEKYERVKAIIYEELASLRDKKISEQNLSRVKNQLCGNMMLSLESTGSRMSRLAKVELFNEKILTPEQLAERIEQVTAEDVYTAANDLFAPDRLVTAAIGKFDEVKK